MLVLECNSFRAPKVISPSTCFRPPKPPVFTTSQEPHLCLFTRPSPIFAANMERNRSSSSSSVNRPDPFDCRFRPRDSSRSRARWRSRPGPEPSGKSLDSKLGTCFRRMEGDDSTQLIQELLQEYSSLDCAANPCLATRHSRPGWKGFEPGSNPLVAEIARQIQDSLESAGDARAAFVNQASTPQPTLRTLSNPRCHSGRSPSMVDWIPCCRADWSKPGPEVSIQWSRPRT